MSLFKRILFAALAAGSVFSFAAKACAGTVKTWDFTKKEQAWKGNGWLQGTGFTAEGAKYKGIGVSPMLDSPSFDLQEDRDYLVVIKMKKDSGAASQMYYGKDFSEDRRVRFDTAPDNHWHEYRISLPSGGKGMRLRIDPLSQGVKMEVALVAIEDVSPLAPSDIPSVKDTRLCPAGKTIKSGGGLSIHNIGCSLFSEIVKVNGEEMASVMENGQMGIMSGSDMEWLDVETVPVTASEPVCDGSICSIVVTAAFTDKSGTGWRVTKKIMSYAGEGRIDFDIAIMADRDTGLVHFPWLTLFAGRGAFGERKNQALFSGLEYLSDEPSSSEADLIGPESKRVVPDQVKITIPLMAVQGLGKFVAVIWNPSAEVQPVFDSPDRVFKSGSTLMGLWPQAVGEHRMENALYPYLPQNLKANAPKRVVYTIAGGEGESVAPAIQEYVRMHEPPQPPEFSGGIGAASEMLACGWLDSKLRAGDMWRHAVWGSSFPPGPAADAPMFMLQLAGIVDDAEVSRRLDDASASALKNLSTVEPSFRSGVGHVRFPSPSLLFGNPAGYIDSLTAEAWNVAKNNFDSQGIRRYVPDPSRLDYSTTHYEKHANGQAATELFMILTAASLSGDDELLKKGLWLLDKQTALYANTVPRGAQTWEIPLHTPDIMASAYMVKCYVLAYKLTGKAEYIEQARYWAWTGLPFVYLVPPVESGIGIYSTIAVYGATSWKSPNWIGLPVQWCGLVYASALYALAEVDNSGPWLKTARGITATGLLMSYPKNDSELCGLLPDSYSLRIQRRNGPDINPGTVQAHLAEFHGRGKLYDFKLLGKSGMIVHAPCEIKFASEKPDGASFFVNGADGASFDVLISRAAASPSEVSFFDTGKRVARKLGFDYDAVKKRLIIKGIKGPGEITLRIN